jgi:toxin-antitoxin system PIN domain toxin
VTVLLDANVLIALAVGDHVHHRSATTWWGTTAEQFATCPITQGALLRLLVRQGIDMPSALHTLGLLTGHAEHVFFPDAIQYVHVDTAAVHGHAQLTDAYLAGLARHFEARLATFDRALAAQATDVVTLVPLSS